MKTQTQSKTPSLLEQAKMLSKQKRTIAPPQVDEIEVILAVMHGDVTPRAAIKVLGKNGGNPSSLWTILCRAVRAGSVTFKYD